MNRTILLTLTTCMAIGLFLSSCESQLEEVKPINTVEITSEKQPDNMGFVTKLFFPKKPNE